MATYPRPSRNCSAVVRKHPCHHHASQTSLESGFTQDTTSVSSEPDAKERPRMVRFAEHPVLIGTVERLPKQQRKQVWFTRRELLKIRQRDALLLQHFIHEKSVDSSHSLRGLVESCLFEDSLLRMPQLYVLEKQHQGPVALMYRHLSTEASIDAQLRGMKDQAYALAIEC